MHRLALFFGAIAIALAAAASYLVANITADYVERSTVRDVRSSLNAAGFDWVSVRADGLLVYVSGPAPDEGSRFKSLIEVKKTVNSARVVDKIKVADPDDLHPPRFSLELLRNGDGISLIGLIPDKTDRETVLNSIEDIALNTTVTDMLETADFPEPEGWPEAVNFALSALQSLPRSKLSVVPGQVTITAITNSQDEKKQIEKSLNSRRPSQIILIMNITAPRPVITPFSLRLIKDVDGVRFDSCSADTKSARQVILAAATRAGLQVQADCTIGLGAPTPRWAEAVATAIGALNDLGGGNLTFSDADITLIASTDTAQADFDRIVYNLEQSLPDVFSVHAVLPPKPVLEGKNAESEPLEFLVTKSPEGLVQMRGRLRDERTQRSINNFAKALFGGEQIYDTTRIDTTMPDGWPSRIFAGLESLAKLHNGLLSVKPDLLELRGISDRPEIKTEITQILSEKLGDSSRYKIDVTYIEALNEVAQLPSPQECVDAVNAILQEKHIAFEPSSTKISGDAIGVVEQIAEVMADCTEVRMEIGGHTDSQGRENMNLTLSQARAEAVLDTLLSLEVLTTNLSAKGYGESQPIADNGTEDGRQKNRRIEFQLIETAADAAQKTGDGTGATATDPVPQDTHAEENNGQD